MNQLMFSFAGLTPPPEMVEAVRRGEASAFCLFAHHNVADPAQLRALAEALYHAAAEGGHLPPLIGIDQEGGQLMAVTTGTTELPGNMALGATRSPELAEQAGRVLGRELLAMGINLNFAPVLDVNVNPDNPAVGTRAFGDDPARVAELGVALIRGLQAEGVLATVKHFPGQGDTATDSHFSLPVLPYGMERLNAVELKPFRAAIAHGVGAVMTTHMLFTALDGTRPATISPAVLQGLLRDDMGFAGLILTDAMDMQAIARFGRLESVRGAIEAGADLALLGHLPDQLALAAALRGAERPAALARIEAARAALPRALPPLDVVGSSAHRAIAQHIAEQAITLVRDDGHLPLRPGPDETIAVIAVEAANLTPADTSAGVRVALAAAIQARHPRVLALKLPVAASTADVSAVLQAAEGADHVIVGTAAAERDPAQAALVQSLYARGQAPVVVALRTPYDLRAFPMIDTYLCAYSVRRVSTEAAARVLFGEIPARGVLPCAIPGIPEATGAPS